MSDLLLIDDDPGQLVAQVRQAFPAPGHRIAVARTSAEGVARVRAAPPDVVLLSLGLPDQCGLAVYRQIRDLDGQVPVIFVTKCGEAKAAIEATKQGAYDCLFKPLTQASRRRWSGRRWRSAGSCTNRPWARSPPRPRRRADRWSALARPCARFTRRSA